MKKLTLAFVLAVATAALGAGEERVEFKLDTSEADAVLAIVAKRATGKPLGDSDWQKVFTSEPYVRLKKREASMGRDFTDEAFTGFVLSEDLAKRAPALQRTLNEWKAADLRATADRILPYLPKTAKVRASVYPVIKPASNSFVFETTTNPAIFLFVDPEESRSAFENTVAHESHHIGLADATKKYDEEIKSLAPNPRKAAEWMGAFGEGLAVLAAAGSPDVHPMRDFDAAQTIRWDQDMKYVTQEFAQVNRFFLDIIEGGFARPEVADHVAYTFMGYRGPWYTVGYKMGQIIEKRFGRAALVACMPDPRTLLDRYNQAAAEINASGKDRLPLWDAKVLKAVGVGVKVGE